MVKPIGPIPEAPDWFKRRTEGKTVIRNPRNNAEAEEMMQVAHFYLYGRVFRDPKKNEAPLEPELCEKLAKLGWQAVECGVCGSSARAFPKPKIDPLDRLTEPLKALEDLMNEDDPEAQEMLAAKLQELLAKHASALTIEQASNPFPQPEPDSRLPARPARTSRLRRALGG